MKTLANKVRRTGEEVHFSNKSGQREIGGQGEPEGRSSLGARTWSQRPLSALPRGSRAARLGREGGEAEAAPTPGVQGGGLGRSLGGSEVRASLARGSGEQPGCAGARAVSSGERVCPTLHLSQAGPGHEAGRELERRAGSRECSPRSPGAGWLLVLSAGACPELGVRLASRQRAEAARRGGVRVRGWRGVGAGAGRRARARAHPGQPGRPLLPVTAAALLVVPLKAAEAAAAAAPDTCGGDPPAARRCGPWRRRCCWAPAAAVSGSGIPALRLVRSTQAPPQECGLHPRRPGGTRRRAERRGEGGGLRGPCAPGAPLWEGPAGHRRLCLLPLLSFPSPFPPRGERAEAPHSPVRTRRKTGNNRNCANPNCKESEGAAAGDPPPLPSSPLAPLSPFSVLSRSIWG